MPSDSPGRDRVPSQVRNESDSRLLRRATVAEAGCDLWNFRPSRTKRGRQPCRVRVALTCLLSLRRTDKRRLPIFSVEYLQKVTILANAHATKSFLSRLSCETAKSPKDVYARDRRHPARSFHRMSR